MKHLLQLKYGGVGADSKTLIPKLQIPEMQTPMMQLLGGYQHTDSENTNYKENSATFTSVNDWAASQNTDSKDANPEGIQIPKWKSQRLGMYDGGQLC